MWLAFVFAVAACLALAVAAYQLAGYSWDQVVSYKTPYVTPEATKQIDAESPAPAPGSRVSRRVVLVIIDGLREDVSRSSMSTLATLRSYGSDLSLTVPQPSLSFPNWTTIMTGATQPISGVTTNWHEGREGAPTLVDAARAAGLSVVVAGPTDFEELFGVQPGRGVSLRKWPKDGYLSNVLVDDALRLSKETSPALVVLHLPDVDEAGHAYGGGSAKYREVARRVDADLSRLVTGLQADGTTFIITADHGHTDSGGHGGPEPSVLHVPCVLAGSDIRLGSGAGGLEQVAPTVAMLLGMRTPAYAQSIALTQALAEIPESSLRAGEAHLRAFARSYVEVVSGIRPTTEQIAGEGGPARAMTAARDKRLAEERQGRLIPFLIVLILATGVFAVIGLASWRALVASLAGGLVYYAVYDGLYFLVHGYRWSLSAFNTETYVKTFMYWRMGEAALAALLGVAVAAAVYPLLRAHPKGPQDRRYLPGYLSLATSTLLVVLGTLTVQVALFWWQWDAKVVWTLPDLRLGFKYDLDLVQMTAVGFAVVLAPLVSYLIGRYHPRVH
jgi:hypothetical protein